MMTIRNFHRPAVYAFLAILLFIIHEQMASTVILDNAIGMEVLISYLFDIPFFIVAINILGKYRLVNLRDYVIFLFVNVALGFFYVVFYGLAQASIDLYYHGKIKVIINREFMFYGYVRGKCVLAFALAIDFFYRGKKGELQAAEARSRQKELEYAMHFTQVSPHLMLNGLTFIHHKAQPVIPVISEAIKKLFSIYRYSTKDMTKITTVTLSEEIEQLSSYLEFQSMLYERNFMEQMQIYVSTLAKGLKIPPMLFFNFVENMFSHGNYIDHPILIQISFEDGLLRFYAKNLIRRGGGELKREGGLGMRHTELKLEHHFQGRFELSQGTKGNFYEVNLLLRYGRSKI